MLPSETFGEDSGAVLGRFWHNFRRPGAPKMEENAFPKPRQKKGRKKVTRVSAVVIREMREMGWGSPNTTTKQAQGTGDKGQKAKGQGMRPETKGDPMNTPACALRHGGGFFFGFIDDPALN